MSEELKAIIELIATLGEHGKEAFFWWLLFDKGLGYLGLISGFGIVGAVVAYVARLVSQSGDETKCLREIRSLVYPEGFGFYTDDDHHRVLNRIKALKEAQK